MTPEGTPLLVPGSPEYTKWARALFFVPAIAGGIFGLIGGYLTDLLGRRRVLTYSILLYAFSALAAGFATSLPMLLFFRCLVFIGVCVEFVAAVAWLAELFPNREQRERVLGWTQAFSSLGGLLVGSANVLAARYADTLPAIQGGHEAWRYTLISGVIPALPLILIRPFLPESPVWAEKKRAGTLRRPSIRELFSPALIRTTVVTTLVFAASYGIAFGAIQQLPQISVVPRAMQRSWPPRRRRKTRLSPRRKRRASPRRRLAGLRRSRATPPMRRLPPSRSGRRSAGSWAACSWPSRRCASWAAARCCGSSSGPRSLIVPALFWWISTQLTNADSLP